MLLMVTVQVATLPLIVGDPQVLENDDGTGVTLGVMAPKLTDCPAGMAVTVTVKVCGAPTTLVAVGGPMATEAST